MAVQGELIVLSGLPGSGKSSFYRKYFLHTHVLISKDLMGRKKKKDQHQQFLVRKALAEGLPVVVDNTNITVALRKNLISIAKKFGVHTRLFYFPLSASESLKRNLGPNRVIVPPVAIYTFHKQLETPHADEGFHQVFEVKILGQKSFLSGFFSRVLLRPS